MSQTPAVLPGSYLEDLQGRRYLNFHGNNVHQVGFAHATVVEAIKGRLDQLSFCTRRYTNQTDANLAGKLGEQALNRMRAMKDRYELIGDVRGLMLGMELVIDRFTKQRANDEAE